MSCSCWWNPETGYLEACPEHEAEAMDRMMDLEERRRSTCTHEQLNKDGICPSCGTDTRADK